MGKLKIEFALTADQIEKLKPLRDMVEKYNTENNPDLEINKAPAIIAQLRTVPDFENPDMIMVCTAGFIPNEKLHRMKKIISDK